MGLPGPPARPPRGARPAPPPLPRPAPRVKRLLFRGWTRCSPIQADELLFPPGSLSFSPCSPGFFFAHPRCAASRGARAAPERSRPGGRPCRTALRPRPRRGNAARCRRQGAGSCSTDRVLPRRGSRTRQPGPEGAAAGRPRRGPGRARGAGLPGPARWPPAPTLPATPFPSGAWAQAAPSVHLSGGEEPPGAPTIGCTPHGPRKGGHLPGSESLTRCLGGSANLLLESWGPC